MSESWKHYNTQYNTTLLPNVDTVALECSVVPSTLITYCHTYNTQNYNGKQRDKKSLINKLLLGKYDPKKNWCLTVVGTADSTKSVMLWMCSASVTLWVGLASVTLWVGLASVMLWVGLASVTLCGRLVNYTKSQQLNKGEEFLCIIIDRTVVRSLQMWIFAQFYAFGPRCSFARGPL